MDRTGKRSATQVVEVGVVADTFATDALPIEVGDQFVRLTFLARHAFGAALAQPENHVVARIAMTPGGFDRLLRLLQQTQNRVH